jgi:hypothetical protein
VCRRSGSEESCQKYRLRPAASLSQSEQNLHAAIPRVSMLPHPFECTGDLEHLFLSSGSANSAVVLKPVSPSNERNQTNYASHLGFFGQYGRCAAIRIGGTDATLSDGRKPTISRRQTTRIGRPSETGRFPTKALPRRPRHSAIQFDDCRES